MSSSPIDDDDVSQDKKQDTQAMVALLAYAKPYRFKILMALSLLILGSVFGASAARFLGQLVDQALLPKVWSAALTIGAGILLAELLAVFSNYVGRRLLVTSANASILDIRKQMFDHLNRLPLRYFDRQPLGKVVTRLTYDVEGLEDFFSGTLARLLSATIALVVVLGAMLLTNFKLGVLCTVAMIPAIALTFAVRSPVRHWNRQVAALNSRINAKLSELLSGIPIIRAFGAEKWSMQEFDRTVFEHRSAILTLNRVNAWSRPIILALCYLPLLVILGYGGSQVLAGAMGVGLLVSFVRYSERFSRPVSELSQEIHLVQQAFTSAERVFKFLNEAPEDKVFTQAAVGEDSTIQGEIEFRNVSMSYDGLNPVLNNVSFYIPKGSKVGLVGRTGSGKTTTISLLARLYEFQQGEICIDGEDIRSWSRESLRTQLGYVAQDVVLFRGSLRDNLCFGQQVSDATLLDAMDWMGLRERLLNRGWTLDSEVQPNGENLSMGERQLVNLTRMVLKDPKILVLDEATANIDPALETLLLESLEKISKGRTSLIIAHRLATLKSVDKILVFSEGRLLEQGTAKELASLGGTYAELVEKSEDLQERPVLE